jgi:hypothetical protein
MKASRPNKDLLPVINRAFRPTDNGMTDIKIVPVKGLGAFLEFCRVPRLIYKGQKGFSPPLDAERWSLYGSKFNPHFKSVDQQAWLAYKDGKIAGRIQAQIYKDIVPLGASPAQFGCLDCIEDDAVFSALIETAETWLRDRGASVINGPFSPSIWSEVGMLVDGFGAVPMIFMPWNPAYLPAMMERHGYSKARDVISYRYAITDKDKMDTPGIVGRPEWRDRLKIRTLDLDNMKAEASLIIDIFNDAWCENWGFVPFTNEEFLSTAESLKYVMPPEGGFMVELDGAPQAFAVVLPNLNEIFRDLDGKLLPFGLPKLISRIRARPYKSMRLALFGVRRALHRKAVGGAVILAFIEECRRRVRFFPGVEQCEFGWVLEDNFGMRRPIELSGAQIDKVHRIYGKDLTAVTALRAAAA